MTATASPFIDVNEAAEMTGATTLYAQTQAIARAAVDAVTDTRVLAMRPVEELGEDTDNVVLEAATPAGPIVMRLLPEAHQQMAGAVGIPYDYYRRMQTGQPDLLSANVNRWLQEEPKRHLMRLLKPMNDEEGRALAAHEASVNLRALLSPKYKILDNAALLNIVLPEAARLGLHVQEHSVRTSRFYVRFAGEEQSLEDVRQRYQMLAPADPSIAGGLVHKFVQEVLKFGASLRNSETGNGSLLLEPFAQILKCLNGMIVPAPKREIHVGREKEDGFVGDDTKRLEDAVIFARIRDRLIEAASPNRLVETAYRINEGQQVPLVLPPELPMFEFLGGVAELHDLSASETEIFKEEVVGDLGRSQYPAGLNRFAVAQGLTALARRMGEGGDFERRVELERTGWQVLTSDAEALVKAAKAHQN